MYKTYSKIAFNNILLPVVAFSFPKAFDTQIRSLRILWPQNFPNWTQKSIRTYKQSNKRINSCLCHLWWTWDCYWPRINHIHWINRNNSKTERWSCWRLRTIIPKKIRFIAVSCPQAGKSFKEQIYRCPTIRWYEERFSLAESKPWSFWGQGFALTKMTFKSVYENRSRSLKKKSFFQSAEKKRPKMTFSWDF